MMYLLVSQHVSGIIMLIIRRMVQNRQRLSCTALAVLQKTREEKVVGVHLLGMVSRLFDDIKIHGTTIKITRILFH
jgi:DNA transposition AAA+ family ATPase